MIRHETAVRVRYRDTDQMGVVYHGVYLEYCETGRTEMLRDGGLPYAALEEEGVLLPVLEYGITMKRPARYDDVLTIVTSMRRPPQARFRLDYQILRGEELLVEGFTVHAFTDRTTFRPVRPPRSFMALMAGGDWEESGEES